MSGSVDGVAMPEQIGRYRILCELGVGGMATVYLGRAEGPKGFERLMAVKVVHPNLARQRAFVDMLFDEARIAARIHHPNVVPVYEIGEDGGRHFIALDYVDGETLASVLVHSWRRKRDFPQQIAAHVLASACEALHAAHELKDNDGKPMGIVHRDVSPQNILLGYDGVVRVTDFGVAKAADRLEHTRPGAIKGKHAYMAPEQTSAKKTLDRRADVFALGVVLWESLTGKRLFKADTDLGTLERVRRAVVPPPSRVRPGVPAALESIALRALERQPDKRYPTAREMGQALREFVAIAQPNLAAPEVEAFLSATFPDRRARREELRKKAAGTNPALLERPASDDALSLSNVESYEAEPTSIDEPSTMDVPGAAAALAEPTLPQAPLRAVTPREPTVPAAVELAPEELAEALPRRRWHLWLGAAALLTALVATVVALQEPTPAPILPSSIAEPVKPPPNPAPPVQTVAVPAEPERAVEPPAAILEAAPVVSQPPPPARSEKRARVRPKRPRPSEAPKEVLMEAGDL